MATRKSANEAGQPGVAPGVLGGRLQFGKFTLDLQRHALLFAGQRVQLTLKPLQVLETLIRRPGEVISKHDLLKAVWKGEFVTDDVLVQAVGDIRRALQDDKDNPAFVQTVPREGYRFIARVAVEMPVTVRRQPPPNPRMVGVGDARGAPVSRAALSRRFTVGLIALVALLGAIGTVSWWRVRPSGWQWSEPRLLASITGAPHAPSFSADGRAIAYLNVVGGVDQLFVWRMGQGSPVQLTSSDVPAASPRWSPRDGRILFSRRARRGLNPSHSRDTIWAVVPDGGEARQIIDDGRNPAWSPDASRIVFERGSDIWTARSDGGNQLRLEGVPATASLLADRTPSFSPDGSRIAFFHPETGPKGDFWTIPATGGQPARLTFDVSRGSRPVWTKDGGAIIFASERSGVSALWSVRVLGGAPQRVFGGAGDDADPDISRDGRRLVFTNTRSQFVLTLLDPIKGGAKELLDRRLKMTYPMFDAQGQRIAFFMQERREGDADGLYTVDITGRNLNRVTRSPSERNTFPHWSADGAWLYFYQTSPSHSFRKIHVEGGPSTEVVAGWTWYVNYGARVDSHQRSIVYSEEHDGVPVKTFVREMSSGRERALPQALDDPRWSRDDRLVLGVEVPAAGPLEGRILICPVDGGPCRHVTQGYLPVWSADNASVYFLRAGAVEGDAELWMAAVSGGDQRKLTDLRPMSSIAHYYDISPRGEVVFVASKPGDRELWMAERRP